METDFISPTKLVYMNTHDWERLNKVLVVKSRRDGKLLAAVIPYDYYLEMQNVVLKIDSLDAVEERAKNNA